MDKTIKYEEVKQLGYLMDQLNDAHTAIFELEQKQTSGMNTPEANEHFAANVESFHQVVMSCLDKIACLSYDLKKELGILNNK